MDWLGLDITSLALIWAAIFLAGLVRGLTGFGLAIVLIPLISLVIPPERAVLLGVLMGVLTSPLGYAKARHSVDPAITRPIIWSGIAVSPIGLYALTITPPDLARIIQQRPGIRPKRVKHPDITLLHLNCCFGATLNLATCYADSPLRLAGT